MSECKQCGKQCFGHVCGACKGELLKPLKPTQRESVTAQAMHDNLAIEACKNLSANALRSGVVEKMVELFDLKKQHKNRLSEIPPDYYKIGKLTTIIESMEKEIIKLLEETK